VGLGKVRNTPTQAFLDAVLDDRFGAKSEAVKLEAELPLSVRYGPFQEVRPIVCSRDVIEQTLPQDTSPELKETVRNTIQDEIIRRETAETWWKPTR